MRFYLCFVIFIVGANYALFAQSCHSALTESAISAVTNLVSNPTASRSTEIKFTNDSYQIDDISSGYFEQFDIELKFPVTIKFNCNTIVPSSAETPYGVLEITEGQWTPATRTLSLSWRIKFNGVQQTTIFILP